MLKHYLQRTQRFVPVQLGACRTSSGAVARFPAVDLGVKRECLQTRCKCWVSLFPPDCTTVSKPQKTLETRETGSLSNVPGRPCHAVVKAFLRVFFSGARCL